jgi:hypothetical protein
MKCIENHPKRNSLMGVGGVSSSTRSLQVTIESLKRELAMRDAIHSYSYNYNRMGDGNNGITIENGQDQIQAQQQPSVYSETLTTNQQNVTVSMAYEYGCKGGLDLKLGMLGGAAGSENVLEVNSLAQAQAMAASLRCALWHACGGEAERVTAALEGMKASYSGMVLKRQTRLSVSPLSMSMSLSVYVYVSLCLHVLTLTPVPLSLCSGQQQKPHEPKQAFRHYKAQQ